MEELLFCGNRNIILHQFQCHLLVVSRTRVCVCVCVCSSGVDGWYVIQCPYYMVFKVGGV